MSEQTYSVSINRKGATHTETLIVNDSTAVAQAFAYMGRLQVVAGELQYISPAVSTKVPGLVCISADIEPITDSAGASVHNKAKLKITYGIPDQDEAEEEDDDEDPSDVGEESFDFSAQEVDLPKGKYVWSSDSAELGEDDARPRIRVPLITFQLKLFNEKLLKKNTYTNLAGKLNAAEFRGFDAETVLYEGASTSRKVTTDGADAWEVTHKFAINPHGWQKLYRTSSAAWEAVETESGGKIYETGDFTTLFDDEDSA